MFCLIKYVCVGVMLAPMVSELNSCVVRILSGATADGKELRLSLSGWHSFYAV